MREVRASGREATREESSPASVALPMINRGLRATATRRDAFTTTPVRRVNHRPLLNAAKRLSRRHFDAVSDAARRGMAAAATE